MESLVYLIMFIIVLVIVAKQGWLSLGAKTADLAAGKLERKLIEVEEEDAYTHARNLGKTADKWANNSKSIASLKQVKEQRKLALARMEAEAE